MKKKEADLAKWENEIGSKEQAFKTAEEARFCTGLFPFFFSICFVCTLIVLQSWGSCAWLQQRCRASGYEAVYVYAQRDKTVFPFVVGHHLLPSGSRNSQVFLLRWIELSKFSENPGAGENLLHDSLLMKL